MAQDGAPIGVDGVTAISSLLAIAMVRRLLIELQVPEDPVEASPIAPNLSTWVSQPLSDLGGPDAGRIAGDTAWIGAVAKSACQNSRSVARGRKKLANCPSEAGRGISGKGSGPRRTGALTLVPYGGATSRRPPHLYTMCIDNGYTSRLVFVYRSCRQTECKVCVMPQST